MYNSMCEKSDVIARTIFLSLKIVSLLLHETRKAHLFIGFLVWGLPSLGGSGVCEVFAQQMTHTSKLLVGIIAKLWK